MSGPLVFLLEEPYIIEFYKIFRELQGAGYESKPMAYENAVMALEYFMTGDGVVGDICERFDKFLREQGFGDIRHFISDLLATHKHYISSGDSPDVQRMRISSMLPLAIFLTNGQYNTRLLPPRRRRIKHYMSMPYLNDYFFSLLSGREVFPSGFPANPTGLRSWDLVNKLKLGYFGVYDEDEEIAHFVEQKRLEEARRRWDEEYARLKRVITERASARNERIYRETQRTDHWIQRIEFREEEDGVYCVLILLNGTSDMRWVMPPRP